MDNGAELSTSLILSLPFPLPLPFPLSETYYQKPVYLPNQSEYLRKKILPRETYCNVMAELNVTSPNIPSIFLKSQIFPALLIMSCTCSLGLENS